MVRQKRIHILGLIAATRQERSIGRHGEEKSYEGAFVIVIRCKERRLIDRDKESDVESDVEYQGVLPETNYMGGVRGLLEPRPPSGASFPTVEKPRKEGENHEHDVPK